MRNILRRAGLFGFFFVLGVGAFTHSGASAATLTTLYKFCSQIHRFGCQDGRLPGFSEILRDGSGNLFGMTEEGGPHRAQGTVYELSPSAGGTWIYKELYAFCEHRVCTDGAGPWGRLVLDESGNLYGTTSSGGDHGGGVVFELSPNGSNHSWTYTKLYDFCAQDNCKDGGSPLQLSYQGQATGALYDGEAPLYGAVPSGVEGNHGGIFALTKSGATYVESTIYSFCASGGVCADGASPNAVLVNAAGALVGTTSEGGGDQNPGVLYSLVRHGAKWKQHVLYTFCSKAQCADGVEPVGGLAIDGAGNIYGATFAGGTGSCDGSQGCGVMFAFAQGASPHYTELHAFCSLADCADGSVPSAPVLDSAGNIFGTTRGRGANSAGTVFELSGGTLQTLYNFCSLADCADGMASYGGLTLGPGGTLYGAAADQKGFGSVFELTP